MSLENITVVNQTTIDNLINVTGFPSLAVNINNFMGGLVGPGILLILFSVVLISMIRKGVAPGFAINTSLFFVTLVSLFLRAVGLVGDLYIGFLIVSTGIGLAVALIFRPDN